MEEDDRNDDAAVTSPAANMEEQDAMLRLLNERMQLQWGQAVLNTVKPSTLDTPPQATTDKAEDGTEEAGKAEEPSFFRLFNSKPSTSSGNNAAGSDALPRVRLQSPSSLTILQGRSLNRILAVEDEEKALVKQRRRNIKLAAVDANWVISTSTPDHWASHPQPPRKLIQKSLLKPSHTRLPLPNVGIAYLSSPRSARTSASIRYNVQPNGKLKLKAYPDLSKERVEDRIGKNAAKKAALVAKENRSATLACSKKAKNAKKSTRVKRKSKKKRMHDREAKKT